MVRGIDRHVFALRGYQLFTECNEQSVSGYL